MNKYRSIESTDYHELERRPEYRKFAGRCPTCGGATEYLMDGKVQQCPKDYDGLCIQLKLFQRYELANVPVRYQRFNYDQDFTDQNEAKILVQEYLDQIDNCILHGVGFYIYSPGLGTGKTAIATHIVKTAVRRIEDHVFHSCWFDSFFRLTQLIGMEDSDRRFLESKFMDSQLLVIDDVVPSKISAKQQAYYSDTLERVIRHRAHASLSTIVTTNMTPEELSHSYDRIFSLLADSVTAIELDSSTDARISKGVTSLTQRVKRGEVTPIT